MFLTSIILATVLYGEIYHLSLLLKVDVENIEKNQNNMAVSRVLDNEPTGAECMSLDLEGSMDTIIDNHEQVFILMPPKAAGTTVKGFTNQCTKRDDTIHLVNFEDHHVNQREPLLTREYDVPSIISSHMTDDQPLIDIAQHSSSKTLLIYIHRDETDRMASAIHMVLFVWMCERNLVYEHGEVITKNNTHCILDEDLVVQHIIKKRKSEIRQDIFTCKAYEALEQHHPNLVFIHYKQFNKLQKLLAKKHCPELLDGPAIEKNTEKDKENKNMKAYLKLKNEDKIVPLVDWLQKKKHLLEWSLELNRNADCQAKTKHMQNELLSCEDETLRVMDGSTWYKQL